MLAPPNPNVRLIERPAFVSPQEVLQLSEPIIVNCTGLGSRALWDDCRVYPIKGQLALLKPEPELNYLFSGLSCQEAHPQNDPTARSWLQYMFPRKDALVIGGTYEPYGTGGASEAVGNMLVSRMKEIFAGGMSTCREDVFPPGGPTPVQLPGCTT
jgi:glycine/D-amino acid oxidase-like deaminating enzyme